MLKRESPHLDTNNNAFLLDDLREKLAVVCLLVEGLVEENDPTNVVGDRRIAGEKDVTEAAAVLLCVLHLDVLQAFSHGSCTERSSIWVTAATVSTLSVTLTTEADLLIHLQPGFPFLKQRFSEQCQRAPSSSLETGMYTDGSSWRGRKSREILLIGSVVDNRRFIID